MNLQNKNTPQEVMEFMDNIKYGWMGTDDKLRDNTIKDIQKFYRVQSTEELLKTKLGICIDDVELERKLFSPNYQTKSFAIITSHMFHAFLLLEKDGIFTYFEYSSYPDRGIYHFLTEEEAIEFALNNFIKRHKIKNRNKLQLVNYPPISPNTTFQELQKLLTSQDNLLDSNNEKQKEI